MTDTPDTSPKPVVIDMAGAMDKLTPELVAAMLPILRDPMVEALEYRIEKLDAQLAAALKARDREAARAEAAEAKVREQALDYLALDGQAIEALTEVERLREALTRIEDASRHYAQCKEFETGFETVAYAHDSTARLARAALTDGG